MSGDNDFTVVLLTGDAPLYMPRYIAPVLDAHNNSITDVINAPQPNSSLLDTAKERYAMLGPRAFPRYAARYAWGKTVNVLPPSTQRSLRDRFYSVQAAAAYYGIPFRTEENVNSDTFIDELRTKDVDLILSIACGQLLKEDILAVPAYGCVNLHGSLLPQHRGRATAFWTLYHGEEQGGVTAHYMTPEFDAGDILMQRSYPIADDDSMHDVYNKLIDTGIGIAIDLLDRFPDDIPETMPNNPEEGSYHSVPGKKERQEFLRRGNRFL